MPSPAPALMETTDQLTVQRRGFLAACGGAVFGGCTAPTASADRTTPDTAPAISVDGGLAWPMGGHGPDNAGYAPTIGPTDQPRLVWDLPVEGIFTLPGPVYRDGTVFFGSGPYAYAVDAATGRAAWTRALDYLAHHFSPAIGDGHLYLAARTLQGARTGGGEGAMYAIAADDGTVDWRLDAPVSSGATVIDDSIYFTSSSGRGVVHAVDTEGDERWTWTDEPPADAQAGSAFGAPAVAGDTLFVTTTAHRGDDMDGGALHALDRSDGSVRWHADTGAESRVSPLVGATPDGPVVYLATAAGEVLAVDGRSGASLWTTDVGSSVLTPPVMDRDMIYLLTAGTVVALARTAGAERWRTDIGTTHMNGMSVTANGVYVGGSDVTALAPADGSVRWQYPISGYSGGFGAPIVLDGVVFTGACIKHDRGDRYDDHLYALA